MRKHETQSYRESCVFHFSHFELYIYIYMLVYIIKSGRKLISMIFSSWEQKLLISIDVFSQIFEVLFVKIENVITYSGKNFSEITWVGKQCIFYAFILERPFREILISYLNYPKLHIFIMSIWKNLKLSRLTWTLLEWL